jgi:CTP:molybdopterin cytidylyltransferase MocA
MSDNVKEAAEQAYATVVAKLAAPYFFEKLAAAGIAPANESEAAEMWAAAQKLHVLYTAEQEKAAAARHNGLAAVNQQLDAVLAASGIGGQAEKQATFNEVAALAADQPEIANAVLTLQAAAAAAMRTAE